MRLAIILIFAQIAFQRLPYPQARELLSRHMVSVPYEGELVFPKSGIAMIDYQKLYPGDYTKIPVRCGYPEASHPPLYVVEESFDHVTLRTKPGYKLKWRCDMAVPDPNYLKAEKHVQWYHNSGYLQARFTCNDGHDVEAWIRPEDIFIDWRIAGSARIGMNMKFQSLDDAKKYIERELPNACH